MATNPEAVFLIEKALHDGYHVAPLGPKPERYSLDVVDNIVLFSNLSKCTEDDFDDEEYHHLCLNCLLLSREFVTSLVPSDTDTHLQRLVILPQNERCAYLYRVANKS
jgi:hypothetical protein